MRTTTVQLTARQPAHDVDPAFVRRWSPRAFRPTPVPQDVLDSMLEAARWAPSSFNEQPWRYVVTQRGPARDALDAAVLPFNRTWTDRAPVLILVAARKTFAHAPVPAGTPNRHASFDTGAATIQLILQGERHGVQSHVIGGLDAAKAHAALGLDPDEEVMAAIALGYPDQPSVLPEPLRERETPSPRRPVDSFARFA